MPDEHAATPAARDASHEASRLARALDGVSLTGAHGVQLALQLIALAPASTHAFFLARRHLRALLDDREALVGVPGGERLWQALAETFAMADGNRELAEEAAAALLAGDILADPYASVRGSWLLLRLERFEDAARVLAVLRNRLPPSSRLAPLAAAFSAYHAVCAGVPADARGFGERALAGGDPMPQCFGAAMAAIACLDEDDLDGAARYVAQAPQDARTADMGATMLELARGRVELARERPTRALDHLTRVREHLRRVGNSNPSGWPWLEPTVRALVLLDRLDEARGAITAAADDARRWSTPRVLAELARCETLVADAHAGAARGAAGLSKREAETAALAAAGHTTAQIALIMRISPHTVGKHLTKAYRAYGVSNRAALAAKLRDRRGGPL
jgi:DNA-binding CsgD family transcriptional regulator